MSFCYYWMPLRSIFYFVCHLLGLQAFKLNTSSGNIFDTVIIPRKWYGLPGILFSLFYTVGLHLLFNSLPMLVLMNVLLLNGYLNFFLITPKLQY